MEAVGSVYIDVIKSLDNNEALLGTQWLQQLVDEVTGQLLALFPSIREQSSAPGSPLGDDT
jgi:hypothetical protein